MPFGTVPYFVVFLVLFFPFSDHLLFSPGKASLAVWITILRFMLDLPEPKYITSQPDAKVKLAESIITLLSMAITSI